MPIGLWFYTAAKRFRRLRHAVRSNNAESKSRVMAHIPDLYEQERLEPKAENMEHHGTTWSIRAHRPGAHGHGDTIR